MYIITKYKSKQNYDVKSCVRVNMPHSFFDVST